MHSVIKEETGGSDGDDRAPPRADLVPARAISLKPAEARSVSPRVITRQCHATAYVEVLEHIPACKALDMGQEVLFSLPHLWVQVSAMTKYQDGLFVETGRH